MNNIGKNYEKYLKYMKNTEYPKNMESNLDNIFYKKYLKYKIKYVNLKKLNITNSIQISRSKNSIQIGGSKNINEYLENLIGMRNEMEKLVSKIREIEPEFLNKNIYLWGNNLNQPAYESVKKLENLIQKFTNYLELNDIPLSYNLDIFFTKELVDSLEQIKKDLTFDKLNQYYKSRQLFYSLEESNVNEILDAIILEFNINNEKDIERIFRSTLFGYNKNYIFGYMVLFRFLLVNKKQLSVIDNNISYLTLNSIFSSLSNSLNSEEYIGILINLINQYIKAFPIKKVINIRNPVNFEKTYGPQSIVSFYELNEKIEIIDRYDVKNNVIIYKSGDIKDTSKANFDDLKQIIYTLVRIPVYKSD